VFPLARAMGPEQPLTVKCHRSGRWAAGTRARTCL